MQILPVLDLLNGVVVRGVAGRRSEYRPLVGDLSPSADPLVVAEALRTRFGLFEIYVADLDAILHGPANWDVYCQLAERGFRLLIDAGLRDLELAARLLENGATAVVVGLETCPAPQLLKTLCATYDPRKIIFSLDLQAGLPLGNLDHWPTRVPDEIASVAIGAGIQTLIVLDLAQVGTGNGLSTLPLCQNIARRHPQVQLITGGGVRHAADLADLRQHHLAGVLIASALHDGRLQPDDLAPYATEFGFLKK